MLTTWHPLSATVDTNFVDKRGRSVGIVCSRTQAMEFHSLSWVWNLPASTSTKVESKDFITISDSNNIWYEINKNTYSTTRCTNQELKHLVQRYL
jgi:hypothetical protein